MNKRGFLPGFLAILIGISGIGVTTSSNSQEAASDRVIEEVMVTARRREEGLSDVPIAIFPPVRRTSFQETNCRNIIVWPSRCPICFR